MVDDLLVAVEHRAHMRFGDGHSDSVSNALSERSRGGLDAGSISVFGVSWGLALPLAELLQIVEGEIVSGEIQRAVDQHRRMAARQNKTVAIEPVWIGRIVAQVLGPQDVREGRQRHWRARMSRVRLLNRVHRQNSDGVDAEMFQGVTRSGQWR